MISRRGREGQNKHNQVINQSNYSVFDKTIKISFAPERKGEIKRSYSDITKAQAVLGFSPEISLKEGVKGVYEWFKARNVADVKNAHILSGSE